MSVGESQRRDRRPDTRTGGPHSDNRREAAADPLPGSTLPPPPGGGEGRRAAESQSRDVIPPDETTDARRETPVELLEKSRPPVRELIPRPADLPPAERRLS